MGWSIAWSRKRSSSWRNQAAVSGAGPIGSAAALAVFQHAIEAAGTLEPLAVRDAIAHTNMDTFFGHILFDARGVNSTKPMAVEQLFPDGKTYTVFPTSMAERAPIYPMPPWAQRQ